MGIVVASSKLRCFRDRDDVVGFDDQMAAQRARCARNHSIAKLESFNAFAHGGNSARALHSQCATECTSVYRFVR